VTLVFQAFFPGRAHRDPYTGLPQEPKGAPARLVLKALPLPLTAIRQLSLRFLIDGDGVALADPGGCSIAGASDASCFLLYPPCESNGPLGCPANGVGVRLEPSLQQAVATGKVVQGEALGFPFVLSVADHSALMNLGERIGLSGGERIK
jgi:hypothetical protein